MLFAIQAKKVFHSMFPEEEFLPRVPDPEDVITEDMDDSQSQPFPSVETSENQSPDVGTPENQPPDVENPENQPTDANENEATPSIE